MAEFWGLIVKGGETKNVQIPDDHVLTVTNAAFSGKAGETAKLYAGVDKKYVLATLSSGRTEQVSLDVTFFAGNALTFGAEGHGEVHLVGALQYAGDAEDFDSDEERAMRAGLIDDEASEGEDGSDDDLEDEEDGEDEDDEDEEDESEEEAPAPPQKKALPAPKPAAAAGKKDEKAKAPQQQQQKPKEQATPAKKDEKAKPAAAATPAKKDDKAPAGTPGKAAQTPAKAAAATPAKGGEKRPATAGKADGETPAKKAKADAKSPGLMCTQCNKPMPNQQALEQHSKAKHKQ